MLTWCLKVKITILMKIGKKCTKIRLLILYKMIRDTQSQEATKQPIGTKCKEKDRKKTEKDN